MAECINIRRNGACLTNLGFDYIGTTLVGYTDQSADLVISNNDFEIIRKASKRIKTPIIAEGNIDTPEKAKRVLKTMVVIAL